MRVKNLGMLFSVLAIAFVLQGCTQSSESNANKNGEANQSLQPLNANSANTAVTASGNFGINNSSVPNGNFVPPVNAKTVSKMPEPIIGNGVNDLAAIMAVRGKLSSDKDLINSVVVEVKEGNATLTGKVASEEQKKKAEDLTRSVAAVKTVKNSLRVSP